MQNALKKKFLFKIKTKNDRLYLQYSNGLYASPNIFSQVFAELIKWERPKWNGGGWNFVDVKTKWRPSEQNGRHRQNKMAAKRHRLLKMRVNMSGLIFQPYLWQWASPFLKPESPVSGSCLRSPLKRQLNRKI